ncbi:MAG: beta-lactamase family protein [Anaerolineaceae bacterium]|nr:beta-lactamase family protein [Anaerolineaceae bacterium]
MLKNFVRYAILFLLLVPTIGTIQAQDNPLVDLIEEYVDPTGPGVVVLAQQGDTTLIGVGGLANLNTGAAIKADDLFRIGSASKTFTATVMLHLAELGEVNLDDPIADYLTADMVDNIQNADEATIRQILQMTSGIFDYTESDAFDDAVSSNPSYPWTAAEVIQYVYGEDAYFPAGDGYYYSNSNYILAQLIIEAVSGQSLADQLQSFIFDPLGMSSCYLETPDKFAKGLVRGYTLDSEFIDITEENDGVGLGDGGIVCDARDLAKFLPALLNGDLLNADTLKQMLNTVEDGDGGQYGLGIGTTEIDYGTLVGHDGATGGFQSNMVYLPDEGISVVVLTNNFDSEVVEDLTLGALAVVLEDE